MRKFRILAVIAAAVLLFCGCNKTSETHTVTVDKPVQSAPGEVQKFSADGMVTVGGETVKVDGRKRLFIAGAIQSWKSICYRHCKALVALFQSRHYLKTERLRTPASDLR